jgi:hypothetical protein
MVGIFNLKKGRYSNNTIKFFKSEQSGKRVNKKLIIGFGENKVISKFEIRNGSFRKKILNNLVVNRNHEIRDKNI